MEHKCTFHICRSAVNLHLRGDKNWMSAARTQISRKGAARIHLNAGGDKEMANHPWLKRGWTKDLTFYCHFIYDHCAFNKIYEPHFARIRYIYILYHSHTVHHFIISRRTKWRRPCRAAHWPANTQGGWDLKDRLHHLLHCFMCHIIENSRNQPG